MNESVVFIGRFRIPDYAAWLPAIERMAAFVEANVPGAELFRAYANDDGTEGTVVYVHPNADSLDQHLAAASALIDDGTQMVEVTSVELLGAPRSATVERLASSGTPVATKRLVAGVRRSIGA